MSYYFSLQYKILNRHIGEFGLHPLVAYLLAGVTFLGLSSLLFIKTEYAAYLYAGAALSFLTVFSERERNDFLKTCFPKKDYRLIRVVENTLLVVPFFAFLLYQEAWVIAFILLGSASVLALATIPLKLRYTLPTPFSAYPFEFTIGFRKSILLLFFAFALASIAISVGNFNLGIFALLVVFLTCLSYYSEPEPSYYVWIFSASPKQFLFYKAKIAVLASTILSLPILLGLSLFFSEHIIIMLAAQLLGYLYLVAFILAKYSAFPHAMKLPQAIFLVLGISMPPLLLGIIPFFYAQSIKRLNEILA